MNGKKVLTTVVCVLAFGGIIANTCVFALNDNKLQGQINDEKADRMKADDELKDLINTTANDLTAAYEAADSVLRTSINTVKNELTTLINTTKTQLQAADLANLVALEVKAGQLSDDIDTLRTNMTNFITTNYSTTSEVNAKFADVNAHIVTAEQDIDDLIVAATKARADIDNITTEITGPDGIIVRIGTAETAIKALQDGLDEVIEDLATVKDTYATIEYVDDEIAQVMGLLAISNAEIIKIHKAMDNFNGKIASLLKETSVRSISNVYVKFPEKAEKAFTDAVTELGITEETDPDTWALLRGMVTTCLKQWNTEIYAQWFMPGDALIILAPTALDAARVCLEYSRRIDSYLMPFEFEVYKLLTIKDIKATGLTDAQKGTILAILDPLTFDTTHASTLDTMDDVEDYLDDRLARCDLALCAAESYDGAVADVAAAKATIEALTNLSTDQKKHYTDMLDTTASFETYMDTIAIDPLDTTTTTETDIEEAADDISEECDLVVYRASGYDDVVSKVATGRFYINLDLPADPYATENAYYNADLDDIVNFTTYTTATDDADEAAVDAVVDNDKAAVDVDMWSAHNYKLIAAAATTARTTLDGLTSIDAAKVTNVKNDINALSDFDTYLTTTAAYATEAEFVQLSTDTVKAIEDMTAITVTENSMIATVSTNKTSVEQQLGIDVDAVEYFTTLVDKAYANYTSFGTDNKIIEGTTPASAQAANAQLIIDVNTFVGAIVDYKLSIMNQEDVNGRIDEYRNNAWTNVFVAKNNNDRDDGFRALEDKADTIDAAVDAVRFSWEFPTFADKDYTTITSDFVEFMADMTDYTTIEATYGAAIEVLGKHDGAEEATGQFKVVEEYFFEHYENPYTASLQKAYIGETLDGETGALRIEYEICKLAADGDAGKLTQLEFAFNAGVKNIHDATRSAEVKTELRNTLDTFYRIVGDYNEAVRKTMLGEALDGTSGQLNDIYVDLINDIDPTTVSKITALKGVYVVKMNLETSCVMLGQYLGDFQAEGRAIILDDMKTALVGTIENPGLLVRECNLAITVATSEQQATDVLAALATATTAINDATTVAQVEAAATTLMTAINTAIPNYLSTIKTNMIVLGSDDKIESGIVYDEWLIIVAAGGVDTTIRDAAVTSMLEQPTAVGVMEEFAEMCGDYNVINSYLEGQKDIVLGSSRTGVSGTIGATYFEHLTYDEGTNALITEVFNTFVAKINNASSVHDINGLVVELEVALELINPIHA